MAAEAKRATSRVRSASDPSAEKKRAQELAGKALGEDFGPGDPNAPKRVVVYGENGIGKTKFFANIPGITFLGVEQGVDQMLGVNRFKGSLDTLEQFKDALAQLRYGKHSFRALAIETLSEVDRLIVNSLETKLAQTAGKDGASNLSEVNELERGAGYDLVRDEWRELLTYLDCIRREREMTICLTAPTRIQNVPTIGGGADYQRYEPHFTSSSKARGLVKGWCDYMLYFAAEVSTTQMPRTKKTVATLGDRYIYTCQEGTHDAKCRGDIAWPRRLPLDIQEGWRMFDELSTLITTHGQGLGKHLYEAAAQVAGQLPPKGTGPTARTTDIRRMDMMRAVVEMLEANDYYNVWEAIDRAKREVAELSEKA